MSYNVNVEVLVGTAPAAGPDNVEVALALELTVIDVETGKQAYAPKYLLPWCMSKEHATKLLAAAPGLIKAFRKPFDNVTVEGKPVSPWDTSGSDKNGRNSVFFAGYQDLDWDKMMAIEDAFDLAFFAVLNNLRELAIHHRESKPSVAAIVVDRAAETPVRELEPEVVEPTSDAQAQANQMVVNGS